MTKQECCNHVFELEQLTKEARLELAKEFARQSKFKEAAEHYRMALQLHGEDLELLLLYSTALCDAQEFEKALPVLQRALMLSPRHLETLIALSNTYIKLGDHDEALELLDTVLTMAPNHVQTHYLMGTAFAGLSQFDFALKHFDQVLAHEPHNVTALLRQARTLQKLGRYEEAIKNYKQCLGQLPEDTEIAFALSSALCQAYRLEEAREVMYKVIRLDQTNLRAYLRYGHILKFIGDNEHALSAYNNALAIDPQNTVIMLNKANILNELQRFSEASESFWQIEQLLPSNSFSAGHAMSALMMGCEWKNYQTVEGYILQMINDNKLVTFPLVSINHIDSAAVLKRQAQTFAHYVYPSINPPVCNRKIKKNRLLRIAYIASSYPSRNVALFLSLLFRAHNRSVFEVWFYYFDSDPIVDQRQNIIYNSVDKLRNVSALTDEEIAQTIDSDGIDIAVDLLGYTLEARPGIFARRCAPLQVRYLGFPGTSGTSYYDYYIATEFLIPPELEEHYTEKIVRIPDYLPKFSPSVLPQKIEQQTIVIPHWWQTDHAMILACFNKHNKITPQVLTIWANLLKRQNHTMLCLATNNEEAKTKLRAYFQQHDVHPDRVQFFSPNLSHDELTKLLSEVVDVYLDTFPSSSTHKIILTLKAKVPVIACYGTSLASRISAELLQQYGLRELVCDNLASYEHWANKLVAQPQRIEYYRSILDQKEDDNEIKALKNYAESLQNAYLNMVEDVTDVDPHLKPTGLASVLQASRAEGLETSLDLKLNHAIKLIKGKAYEQAHQVLQILLKKQPKHFKILYLLAMTCYYQRRNAEALDLMLQAIEVDSSNPQAYVNLALMQRTYGHLHEAIKNYQHALQLNPNFAEAYLQCGNTYFDLLEFSEAEHCYQMAITIDDKNARAYANLAVLKYKQHKYSEALTLINRALDCDPHYAHAHRFKTVFDQAAHSVSISS